MKMEYQSEPVLKFGFLCPELLIPSTVDFQEETH